MLIAGFLGYFPPVTQVGHLDGGLPKLFFERIGEIGMNRTVALLGLLSLLITSTVNAAVSDEEFQDVKALLQQALARITQLEASNAQTNATVVELAKSNVTTAAAIVTLADDNEQTIATDKQPVSWAKRISWSGDFRYRYQNDDIDISADDRNRQRIRVRSAMVAKLTESIDTVFGIATAGDSPVTSNLTLGNSGSSKQIKLDLAYFDWEAINNLNVRGGKFDITFALPGESLMQWDSDWRPEGMDVAYKGETFFAQFLGTWLESDRNLSKEYAWIVQAGAKFNLGPARLKVGFSYTDIDAAERECFFKPAVDGSCFGNNIDPAANTYLFDFEVYDVFAEVGFNIGKVPITAWVDYIKNNDAPIYDQGYQLGFQLGKAQNRGSWQIKYYYQDLEANATLGLLANSDFGGGGTNGKGSFVQAAYATTDKTNIKLTYYAVEKNQNMNPRLNGGAKFDWDTLSVDLNFNYK